MSTFRTKLVIKRWKYSAAIEAMKQIQAQGPQNLPPNSYQYKNVCNRCGVDMNGCRPFPCPHGAKCGIPVQHDILFTPSLFTTLSNGIPRIT